MVTDNDKDATYFIKKNKIGVCGYTAGCGRDINENV